MPNKSLKERQAFVDALFNTGKRVKVSELFNWSQRVKEKSEDVDVWRQLFIETLDPTEYEGALALGFTWGQWNKFKYACPKFAVEVTKWIEEIEVKVRSMGIAQMRVRAETDSSSAAARYIADGSWNKEEKKTKTNKDKEKRIKSKADEEADAEVFRVKEAISNRPTQH